MNKKPVTTPPETGIWEISAYLYDDVVPLRECLMNGFEPFAVQDHRIWLRKYYPLHARNS